MMLRQKEPKPPLKVLLLHARHLDDPDPIQAGSRGWGRASGEGSAAVTATKAPPRLTKTL
eukprot:8598044-Pyramimonas_sp.AAC.1